MYLFGVTICLSFNELKFKSCRNIESDSSGFFEVNFYSHCGNIGTKNVPLQALFDFETVKLLPLQMDSLHTLTIQWKGANPICLNDLILQGDSSKIQLLENFPRDDNLERRAWFSNSCIVYDDRMKTKKKEQLFEETCAVKRYFHFMRFQINLCEESLVCRFYFRRLPFFE